MLTKKQEEAAEEYARKWRTIHILRKDYPRVKYLAALKEVEIGDLFSELIDNEFAKLGTTAAEGSKTR